jgi:hypothetical protein
MSDFMKCPKFRAAVFAAEISGALNAVAHRQAGGCETRA